MSNFIHNGPIPSCKYKDPITLHTLKNFQRVLPIQNVVKKKAAKRGLFQ